jgi:CheY-like chemotaxis protein
MSISFSSEHFAGIHDGARRLAAQAGDHEDDLEGLLRATAADVRQAQTALSHALESCPGEVSEWQRDCSSHLMRSVECASAAHRACASARQQLVNARRLLTRLERDSVEQQFDSMGRAPSVLVVDDIAEIRELVAFVLRDAGFVVRTAVNGLEALIAAYEMEPAVIVMDMTMPVLDGIEATRLIKTIDALRHARVIAYTADPSILEEPVQEWFVAVLPKPSSPDIVLSTVQAFARL